MTTRAISTRARPFATVELSVKCPLQYPDARHDEGVVWKECGEELDIEIDHSCYLPSPEWRVGRCPNGCPHGHAMDWTKAERTELDARILTAWENWQCNQEIR